jgi:hypothetical protein
MSLCCSAILDKRKHRMRMRMQQAGQGVVLAGHNDATSPLAPAPTETAPWHPPRRPRRRVQGLPPKFATFLGDVGCLARAARGSGRKVACGLHPLGVLPFKATDARIFLRNSAQPVHLYPLDLPAHSAPVVQNCTSCTQPAHFCALCQPELAGISRSCS